VLLGSVMIATHSVLEDPFTDMASGRLGGEVMGLKMAMGRAALTEMATARHTYELAITFGNALRALFL